MGLLSGNTLKGIFGRAFRPIYEDGRLIQVQKARLPNGTLVDQIIEQFDVKIQLDAVTEDMRQAEGYASTDQRCLILRDGLPIEHLDTDCRLVARDYLWTLHEVTTDPARSYFEARAARKELA